MDMPDCGWKLLRWQQMTLCFKQCARAEDGYAACAVFWPTLYTVCSVTDTV